MSRLGMIAAMGLVLWLVPGLSATEDPLAKTADTSAPQPMLRETRLLVIRSLSSELAYVRHVLPQGRNGVTVKDRRIIAPAENELNVAIDTYGPASKPGERVQITSVDIKSDRIILQLNGGPQKKAKWYQHIEIEGAGGTLTPSPPPDPNAKNPHGSVIVLVFNTRFVPEMTGDEVRQLLWPVLDFSAKSQVEAYLETIPPKAKQAIQSHQILVGMDREMVVTAKGRPERKIRERDAEGKEYEEWLYGTPPQEVQFVRFQNEEVVRLEIMPVSGEKIIRTEKEIDLSMLTAHKQTEPQVSAAPAKAPSLRRPDEIPPGEDQSAPRGGISEDEKQPKTLPKQ